MAGIKKNWYTHPRKTTLLILITIWLTGLILLLSSITDQFNQPISWNALLLLSPYLLGSTAFVYEMGMKYMKNTLKQSKLD